MLKEKDDRIRYTAATALLGMGDSADTVLSVIQETLQDSDNMIAQNQAYQLGELGERAKAAVPIMVQAMTTSSRLLRIQLIRMMEKVDPWVATELRTKGYDR
jgi:HEAT repeat protein